LLAGCGTLSCGKHWLSEKGSHAHDLAGRVPDRLSLFEGQQASQLSAIFSITSAICVIVSRLSPIDVAVHAGNAAFAAATDRFSCSTDARGHSASVSSVARLITGIVMSLDK
jgi:hypothetical protein